MLTTWIQVIILSRCNPPYCRNILQGVSGVHPQRLEVTDIKSLESWDFPSQEIPKGGVTTCNNCIIPIDQRCTLPEANVAPENRPPQ